MQYAIVHLASAAAVPPKPAKGYVRKHDELGIWISDTMTTDATTFWPAHLIVKIEFSEVRR